MSRIDYTKPIKANSRFQNDRNAFVLRVFKNGSALVAIDSREDKNPIIFGPEGEFVGCPDTSYGEDCGSSLSLHNTPVEQKLYLRLSAFAGLEQTSIDTSPIPGDAVACIEVTLKDGLVTGAELQRANTYPIRRINRGCDGDVVELSK